MWLHLHEVLWTSALCLLLASLLANAQSQPILCDEKATEGQVCTLYPSYRCCPNAASANVDAFEGLRTLPLELFDRIGLLGGITTVMSTINYLAPVLFANICVAIWHIRRESVARARRAGGQATAAYVGVEWLVFAVLILATFYPLVLYGLKQSMIGNLFVGAGI